MPFDAARRIAKIARFAAAYGTPARRLADVLNNSTGPRPGDPVEITRHNAANYLVQAEAAMRQAYEDYRRGQREDHDRWVWEQNVEKEGMALQQLQEEVAIEWGERRDESGQSSNRVYFFYVTPTGLETGLKECQQIRPKWSKGGNTDFFGNRTAEMGYTVSGPFTLKMVCMASSYGKPRQRANIYIDVNPGLERIEIKGPDGFGRFLGRGEVNYKMSGMTKAQFEKVFKLEVLAARATKAAKNVRSLIY